MDERIQKYFQEELSAVERLKLLRLVEVDDELKQQFIKYKNMHALLALSDEADNMDANKQGLQRFNHMIKGNKIRRILLRVSSYAAVIALCVIATWWITMNRYQTEEPFVATNTLYIPAGQRMKITLGDGTDVWLNAKTTFSYPAVFSGKERRVTVEGEAFFDVAKNPEQPFIVSSGGVEMKVLGTKFNVHGYAGNHEVQTSLIEGSLQVYLSGAEKGGVILKPNEQVTVKENSMQVTSIPYTDYFLWTDGIYSFDNEPLGNILKRLELYYDIKIVVTDPSISKCNYRGKFRQRDGIDEILRMIQRIHKFKIEKDEVKNQITLSK